MTRKAVAATVESISSNPTEDAPSSQTAVECRVVDQGEPSTGPPASGCTEIIGPIMQPSHTIPAEKEPAYTTEKEAIYNGAEKEAVYNPDDWKEVHKHEVAELPITTSQQKRKICGLPKIWCLGLTALITVILIAVAVALGAFFGTRHSHSSSPAIDSNITIGGALDPQFFSTTGAFNGTGVALASFNFGVDSSIFVFYQYYNGQIRLAIQEADGQWTGSTVIVASGARNATPISAVAYITSMVATWHVFYIDFEGFVRERIASNDSAYGTNLWNDGPINKLNLKANDADMIGLQACYWGNFYSDSDYVFAVGFNATNPNVTTAPTGMHLWYADSDTTFQQYSLYVGEAQWLNDNQTWHNVNGHAGVGCQTWDSGTTSYVSMVDLENNINIWWKDTNSTTETPSHPTNLWVQSNIVIPNVHPSTSMAYTNYFTYQGEDGFIRGANISWAAENSTIAPSPEGGPGLDVWKIPTPGVPGTHLTITALGDISGGSRLSVWFQMNGSDITEWLRDDTSGTWMPSDMPVNN